MKTSTSSLVCAIFLCANMSAEAQGTFQNLDFESAVIVAIPGDPYGRVQFAQAFPGWTGYIGTNIETLALYNDFYLDSAGLGLQGITSGRAIQGSFTAMLESGYFGTLPNRATASLAQTGLVPSDARSIRFMASGFGPFQVALGAQNLAPVPLVVTPTYTIYGADVTALAGATAELRFTALLQPTPPNVSLFFVDSVLFSPEAVPEPSALGLFVMGIATLCRRRL